MNKCNIFGPLTINSLLWAELWSWFQFSRYSNIEESSKITLILQALSIAELNFISVNFTLYMRYENQYEHCLNIFNFTNAACVLK